MSEPGRPTHDGVLGAAALPQPTKKVVIRLDDRVYLSGRRVGRVDVGRALLWIDGQEGDRPCPEALGLVPSQARLALRNLAEQVLLGHQAEVAPRACGGSH